MYAKWSAAFTESWYKRGPESLLVASSGVYTLLVYLIAAPGFWGQSSLWRDFVSSILFTITATGLTDWTKKRCGCPQGGRKADVVDRLKSCAPTAFLGLVNAAIMSLMGYWN